MSYSQAEIERFFKCFTVTNINDCWEWTSWKMSTGYGGFYMKRESRKTFNAHRVAWELFHLKSIPTGKVVCHTCDNRSCVNPRHLYLGESKDNNTDTLARKRGNRRMGNSCSWTKINEESLVEILNSNETQSVLAEKFSVHQSTISDIKRGKRRSLSTGLSLKSCELLEHPESPSDYSMAGNGECECLKIEGIGQSAAKLLSDFRKEKVQRLAFGRTPKQVEAQEEEYIL